MNHKTVKVHVGDLQEQIDVEIAPLIRELWKARILTLNSCQENRPGIAWVQFATSQDCTRFLDIVAEYDDDSHSLYNRMACRWDDIHNPVSHWEYSISPIDFALTECPTDDGSIDESHAGVPQFEFSVSVRFPTTDLPVLVDRLRQYNGLIEGETLEFTRQHHSPPDWEDREEFHTRVLRRLKGGKPTLSPDDPCRQGRPETAGGGGTGLRSWRSRGRC